MNDMGELDDNYRINQGAESQENPRLNARRAFLRRGSLLCAMAIILFLLNPTFLSPGNTVILHRTLPPYGHFLDFYIDASDHWKVSGDFPLGQGNPAAVRTANDNIYVYGRSLSRPSDNTADLLQFQKYPGQSWKTVNRSAEVNGVTIADDPTPVIMQSGDDSVVTRGGSDSGPLLKFDKMPGSPNPTVSDISFHSGGGFIFGKPTVFVDGRNTMHVYTQGPFGHVHEFQPSDGENWKVTDHTNDPGMRGATISGNPVPLVLSGSVHNVYSRDARGHLLEFYFSGDGASWTVFDHTLDATGGMTIMADPAPIAYSGDVNIFATGPNGHLLQFYLHGNERWKVFDVTTAVGGRRIQGTPSALFDGAVHVFGRDPNGHLVEFYQSTLRPWAAFDHTVDVGGQTINSDPIALGVAQGAFHVFARG